MSREWIPHNNVSLFSARGDESMLRRVNERVNSFLMESKRLVLFKLQLFDVMDMNKSIERGGNDIIQIGVILDFCDPSSMDKFFDNFYTNFFFLERNVLSLCSGRFGVFDKLLLLLVLLGLLFIL